MGSTPLLFKELAWKAIRFASKCGPSHPISFALRPIVTHKNLQKVVGAHLAIMVFTAAILNPLSSAASDTGGVPSIMVIPVGEVKMVTEEAIRFPLPHREMSQGYWLLHSGVDYRAPIGTPINPVMLGIVTEAESDKYGYGQRIVISHKNGYSTLYAHLSKIEVQAGDKVTTESKIGEVGSTGRSTGPHLHLEIHDESGRSVNPTQILGNK